MSFEKVLEELPSVVEQFREENEIKLYTIIKDDIFRLLNKYCIIIYYPLEDESNWGFRTKRFVNGKLEDFVFINTARTLAEQVFIAAHELGHVWDVNSKLAEIAPESKNLTAKEEEDIIDRFAAELLMPPQRFKGSFMENIMILGLNTKVIRIEDLIRVMVLLMRDYMVPYESVRRRLLETKLLSESTGKTLEENEERVSTIVKAVSNDLNIFIDRPTKKKAIPGLRALMEKIEKDKLLDAYTISKIKTDFDLSSINEFKDTVNISDGDM